MVDDTSKLKFVIRPRIGETLPQRSTFLGHPPSKESVPFKPISKANPGILKFTIEGVQISPGSWCSNCRNGGDLIICAKCEINSICTECIDFDLGKNKAEEIRFECPTCFVKANKSGEYPFLFSRNSSARQHWPNINTTPLAIISMRLQGMKDIPSIIAYHHIQSWLCGNLVHVDFDFDLLKNEDDAKTRLNSMLDRFESGNLKSCSRFLIFLTTHSDPETGYLHITPDNGGSIPISEVFNTIFPIRFQNILKRSDDNILTLLSCGASSTLEEPRKAIARFANRGFFSKIFSFSQQNFQPFFAHSFIMEVALQHFIYDRYNLGTILRDHQELGAHTDVVEFLRNKTITYRWTHHGSRPMGFELINQCTTCRRLKPWKITAVEDNYRVELKCTTQNCGTKIAYTFPREWKWVSGPPIKSDERGAWIVRTDAQENKDAMDVA